jgi:hypothetical protein
MICKIIIAMIIIIIILFIYCRNNNYFEHLNEGTFHHLTKNIIKDGKPYIITNLESRLYPMCTKDIRSDAATNRYCNDLPSYKKYTEILYKNQKFIQTKYPSYFYPPYSTKIEPHHIFAPDWHHRFE